ncbi:hypothetical protein JCM19992_16250 [Thermostilla marina]
MKRAVVLCPTYRRVRTVPTALACFLMQRVPADWSVRLYLFDDSGSLEPCEGIAWSIESTAERAPSLPAKYNRMVRDARARFGPVDAWILFDDDDLYLPEHVAGHLRAFERGAAWSKPSLVWTTYGGLHTENAAGRFHGSIALSNGAVEAVGGWIESDRETFDQEFLAALEALVGPPAEPPTASPQYVFRWNTGCWHAQHAMGRADWYRHVERLAEPVEGPFRILPRLDPQAASIFRALRVPVCFHE